MLVVLEFLAGIIMCKHSNVTTHTHTHTWTSVLEILGKILQAETCWICKISLLIFVIFLSVQISFLVLFISICCMDFSIKIWNDLMQKSFNFTLSHICSNENPIFIDIVKIVDEGMDWVCKKHSRKVSLCKTFWQMVSSGGRNRIRLDQFNLNRNQKFVQVIVVPLCIDTVGWMTGRPSGLVEQAEYGHWGSG